MATKKIVESIEESRVKDLPENLQVADWLGKTRGRLDRGQRNFYENIGVKQQTGDNYEGGKTPVPAWVAIRAIRTYGDANDLRWWMDLTLESKATRDEIGAAVDETLSGNSLNEWAQGNIEYQKLTPERAQRLHRFVEESVELFARGLKETEDHLINQVRVLNELASNVPTTPGHDSTDKQRKINRAAKDAQKNSAK
jgi:hypothetical protein